MAGAGRGGGALKEPAAGQDEYPPGAYEFGDSAQRSG